MSRPGNRQSKGALTTRPRHCWAPVRGADDRLARQVPLGAIRKVMRRDLSELDGEERIFQNWLDELLVHKVPTHKEAVAMMTRLRELEIAMWTAVLQMPDARHVINEWVKEQALARKKTRVANWTPRGMRKADPDLACVPRLVKLPGVHRAPAERCYRAALAIREEMVVRNSRLAMAVAKRHHHHAGGISLLDLVQAGQWGLMLAVGRYNIEKGMDDRGAPYTFATFASWWIEHAVRREVGLRYSIRLPVYVIDELRKVRRADEAGELPEGMTPEHANKVLQTARVYVSLDAAARPTGSADDRDITYGELIADTHTVPTDDTAVDEAHARMVELAMKCLNEKERAIVKARFAIGPEYDSEATLTSVGSRYGLSRERIRQIEAVALRKMRPFLARRGFSGSDI